MQRQTLITLLLSVFIALLGIGIIIPVLPVFATELGAGGFALGMTIAAFSVTRGLLQPVVGNFSDTLGRKGFLVTGLFIYGLVGLLIPHAASILQLLSIRAFHGIGSAMIVPIAMAYMSVLAPDGQEGRYMGYLNVAVFCGIGCGPVVGGVVNDYGGMAAVFYLMALFSFAACLLVIRFMPAHQATGQDRQAGLWASIRGMAGRRRTVGILCARYATMIVMVPTMAFLPLVMMAWPGTTGLQVGLVIAGRTLINALLQVMFGKLADRYEKSVLLMAGVVAMVMALLLIPLAVSFPQMLAIYCLLGLGEAMVWPVLGAYASEEGKAHFGHGTMMGVFSLAMSGGVFTGAILAGFSLDHWGTAPAFILSASAICLLTGGSVVLIRSGER